MCVAYGDGGDIYTYFYSFSLCLSGGDARYCESSGGECLSCDVMCEHGDRGASEFSYAKQRWKELLVE